MQRTKLLNRIDCYEKSGRVITLLYRHKTLVLMGRVKPLTKEQYYRLTTLKKWYEMQELLEKAKAIESVFGIYFYPQRKAEQ